MSTGLQAIDSEDTDEEELPDMVGSRAKFSQITRYGVNSWVMIWHEEDGPLEPPFRCQIRKQGDSALEDALEIDSVG